jgi:hypothetical protein
VKPLALLASVALIALGCGGDDRRRGGVDGAAGVDGGPGFDAGPVADGSSCGASCEACFACPETVAACASAQDACTAEPDCLAFRGCIGESDDPMTVATCRVNHPAGAAAFCAYWGCLTYEQCDALCEDAVVCPRL